MKNIKKLLVLLLALAMVFALCACGNDADDDDDADDDKGGKVHVSDKDKDKDKDKNKDKDKKASAEDLIVGDWETELNMLDAMEMMGYEGFDELTEYFDFGKINYTMAFSFDEDGEYEMSMTVDVDVLEKVLRDGMVKLLEESLEGTGYTIADAAAEEGMTEDELLDELIEDSFGDLDDMADLLSYSGTYEIDGDKLILDGDEESYDVFEVDEDELTFVKSYVDGEKEDNPFYPLTFDRV